MTISGWSWPTFELRGSQRRHRLATTDLIKRWSGTARGEQWHGALAEIFEPAFFVPCSVVPVVAIVLGATEE